MRKIAMIGAVLALSFATTLSTAAEARVARKVKAETVPAVTELEDQSTEEAPEITAEYIDTTKGIEQTETEINEHDLDLMTKVLVGECHGYSWEHQIAVGSVVLNRVADPRFPDSIEKVLYQKGQYACFLDGNAYRQPTERNREVAEYLLRNGSQIPSNVVWQSQRRQGKGLWQKIDKHFFCY